MLKSGAYKGCISYQSLNVTLCMLKRGGHIIKDLMKKAICLKDMINKKLMFI